ncbi:hypothetical protein L207DRAFT_537631 [Hyaloscypha variabilis F]|uniref:Uncharacterized protein n=1 Tax=Hyaloscypha variabilis (strain UAMH 11265 / GT02V1 / F) TaxID=1149755 RepID=A0A2J6QWZ7_HYAVF|nr:hypothetical protein L207DRAFT_537631 [Hyaloscypha variabilis F]
MYIIVTTVLGVANGGHDLGTYKAFELCVTLIYQHMMFMLSRATPELHTASPTSTTIQQRRSGQLGLPFRNGFISWVAVPAFTEPGKCDVKLFILHPGEMAFVPFERQRRSPGGIGLPHGPWSWSYASKHRVRGAAKQNASSSTALDQICQAFKIPTSKEYKIERLRLCSGAPEHRPLRLDNFSSTDYHSIYSTTSSSVHWQDTRKETLSRRQAGQQNCQLEAYFYSRSCTSTSVANVFKPPSSTQHIITAALRAFASAERSYRVRYATHSNRRAISDRVVEVLQ